MTLVHATDLISNAIDNRYTLLEMRPRSLAAAFGLRDVAEACDAPIVVGVSDDALGVGLADAMPALEMAFSRSKVPVVLHRSNIRDRNDLIAAIRLGFGSVTLGATPPPDGDFADLVELGRSCCVATEIGGAHWPLADAQPEPAADILFLEGSPHLTRRKHDGLPPKRSIPVALHATHPPINLADLVAGGLAKISLDFEIGGDDAAARFGALAEVTGSAFRGRAALAACRSYAPVEHVVAFNAPALSTAEVDRLFALGAEVLGAIAGVRRVRVGRAIAENARYRLCWFVRFANAAVAEAYRNDPAHLAFADRHFRPVAADRMTIDFELGDR